jgi:hypothetical protein
LVYDEEGLIDMEAKDTVTKRYLNATQAYAYLGIGKTKFYELVKRSLIRVTIIGGTKRYDVEDLDSYAMKGRV